MHLRTACLQTDPTMVHKGLKHHGNWLASLSCPVGGRKRMTQNVAPQSKSKCAIIDAAGYYHMRKPRLSRQRKCGITKPRLPLQVACPTPIKHLPLSLANLNYHTLGSKIERQPAYSLKSKAGSSSPNCRERVLLGQHEEFQRGYSRTRVPGDTNWDPSSHRRRICLNLARWKEYVARSNPQRKR